MLTRPLCLIFTAVVALATSACDRFPGYRVWLTNESDSDLVVVLSGHPDDRALGLPAYALSAHASLAKTLFFVTEEPSAKGLDAEIVIYDSTCRRVGVVKVTNVGEYALTVEQGLKLTLEPLDAAHLPPADELVPTPGRCTAP